MTRQRSEIITHTLSHMTRLSGYTQAHITELLSFLPQRQLARLLLMCWLMETHCRHCGSDVGTYAVCPAMSDDRACQHLTTERHMISIDMTQDTLQIDRDIITAVEACLAGGDGAVVAVVSACDPDMGVDGVYGGNEGLPLSLTEGDLVITAAIRDGETEHEFACRVAGTFGAALAAL